MRKTLIIALMALFVIGCQKKEETALTEVKEVNETSEVKFCTKDAKMCPDGRTVGRDPNNNCEFFSCDSLKPNPKKPHNEVMCTADVKECPDGSYVGRDHKNNCKFKPCPDGQDANGRDIE